MFCRIDLAVSPMQKRERKIKQKLERLSELQKKVTDICKFFLLEHEFARFPEENQSRF